MRPENNANRLRKRQESGVMDFIRAPATSVSHSDISPIP